MAGWAACALSQSTPVTAPQVPICQPLKGESPRQPMSSARRGKLAALPNRNPDLKASRHTSCATLEVRTVALDNSTGAVAELHKICIDLFICLQLAASDCNSLPFLIKVISLRKGLILLGSSALSRPCGEVAEWLKAAVC